MTEAKTNNGQAAKKNSRPLIYVVDDEPMLLELAAAILEPEGYHIETYRDPQVALRTFNEAKLKPALLITDYAMHSMNGMQLIEKFRQTEPKQKILLVSGTVGEDIFEGAEQQPNKFLAKPYQAGQLTKLVKALLAAH